MDYILSLLADGGALIKVIEEEGDLDRPSRAIKKVAPRMGLSGLRIARKALGLWLEGGL